MARLRWLKTFGGAAALSALVLAGCGGKGSTTSATTKATTAANVTTTVVGGSTTVPTFSGSKNSRYCELARQLPSASTSDLTDVTKVKALFEQFDAFAAQFLAVVPAPIKSDGETVVSGLKQLEASLKAANYDITKVDPSSLSSLTDPTFIAATDRIDAYDTQVCGITTTTSP
ncbi:MAG: hypothetical protein QOF30_1934 [Acidimicrobiaceae bacterium]|jgi:hypothetical protein|nr:hypothetical protein [Acidimicrobiaceae bacterium]